jgi:hypothetical protein
MAADCFVVVGVVEVHPHRAAASPDEGLHAHPARLVTRMPVQVSDQVESTFSRLARSRPWPNAVPAAWR